MLWKYELEQQEVNYLLEVLNTTSVKGEAQVSSLLKMIFKLRTPLNAKELSEEARKTEEIAT